MQGNAQGTKLDTAGRTEISKDNLGAKMLLDARAIRVCCGHPIEPHLAEIRNLSRLLKKWENRRGLSGG